VGLPALLLAALLVMRKWREPRVLLLLGVALVGVLMASGSNGVVYDVITKVLPPVKSMRFPVKFITLAVFALPFLAALGAARLEEDFQADERENGRRLLGAGAGFLAVLLGLAVLAKWMPVPADDWGATLKNALLRGAWLAAFAGGLLLWHRQKPAAHPCILYAGVLAVIWLDLLTHAPRQNPTVRPWVYEPALLATNRGFAAPLTLDQGRAFLRLPDEESLGHYTLPDAEQQFAGARQALYLNLNLLEKIPTPSGLFPLTLRETEQVLGLFNNRTNSEVPRLADFLGIRYINEPGKYYSWQPRATAHPLVTAGQQPVFAAPRDTLRGMKAPDFAPERMVFLPLETQGLVHTNGAAAKVSGVKAQAHCLEFQVESDRPAWAVIAQAWYPCWQAQVDAQPARLWRANHAFQALEVPAGAHRVTLRYHDTRFRLGVMISLFTLAACGLLWWRLGVQERSTCGQQTPPTAA
jgi:hypothetical protein